MQHFTKKINPLSTTAVHILVPSTAAESGTTAIVALSHSLVLTAFCLNFYDFGHACSKPITGSDCIILYQLIFVFGASTVKNTKESWDRGTGIVVPGHCDVTTWYNLSHTKDTIG